MAPNAPTDLGQKIREARREANLTQHQLGVLIGAREHDVNRWENGHHGPRGRDRLEKIARATGKPLSYFLDEVAA